MRIHAICTFPQYRRHVEAIWKHIDPTLKGEMRTEQGASTRGWPSEDIVMIGGFYDMDRVPLNRMIYVEHGAGQSYHADEETGRHPAYHGSEHPDTVIAYISPNQRVADSWGRPAFVAGCPAIDNIKAGYTYTGSMVAAITFHWDARRVAQEAWSAKRHWMDDLTSVIYALVAHHFEVIGTWHPRDPFGRGLWEQLQVEPVQNPDEVLGRAHLLIADNTSLQYEAGKLGIPNIVLNAPWYRRDVEHGLRFWDHVPGRMMDNLEDWANFDPRKYFFDPESRRVAKSAGDYAFEHEVGTAGTDAARWIEKFVHELA